MAEFYSMGIRELRQLVRQQGWRGTSVLEASKAELVAYLSAGQRSDVGNAEIPHTGPLCWRLDSDRLTVTSGRATITAPVAEWRAAFLKVGIVPESRIPEKLLRKFQERSTGKIGRPAPPVPTDIAPLLKTFRNAEQEGAPFYRTGRRGAYSRRDELPAGFRELGRDRLERLIAELVEGGEIVTTAGGKLSVPKK